MDHDLLRFTSHDLTTLRLFGYSSEFQVSTSQVSNLPPPELMVSDGSDSLGDPTLEVYFG
jgi:hypothetical protein